MPTRKVYMDHNATTPLHPEVAKAMTDAMTVFGNPSSLHEFGRQARSYVEDARQRTAEFLGASADEVVFVGSGSEGNNTILSILACPAGGCSCGKKTGSRIVTSVIEHPCILETARCLQGRGTHVTYVSVDEYGKVDLDQLRRSVDSNTGLVSVMMANNEIGVIQDIRDIARIAHEHGALCHTDAVQAFGKIPINVRELGVDFLTLSAHKVYGPKGIGAIYVRNGTPYCPFIRGGHQERGRRAGTENTLGIVGLGKAVEMRAREMKDEYARLTQLRALLREGIRTSVPDVHFNEHPTDSLPNTLNVSFDGAEGESILLYLDLEGIAVSTGSACASGSLEPSHVLLAIHLPHERAHGAIRFSMGRQTTAEDIDYVLEALPDVIRKIRRMSTTYVAGRA